MSRPHFGVTTSRQQKTCRDIKAMSRHHSSVPRPRPQNGGRDTVSPAKTQARSHPMSRHQFHVATSLEATLCRDIDFMSRPPTLPPMSRHHIHVATSPHCYPCRDLKMMSRHPINLAPLLLRRDAISPCRDVPCCHPCRDIDMMSRHRHDVATSTPLVQVATPTGRRDLALSGPGRGRVAQVVGARWRYRACCCARSRPCPTHQLPSCHDLNTRS